MTVEQEERLTGDKPVQDSARVMNQSAILVKEGENQMNQMNNKTMNMGGQVDECVLVKKKTWCERHNCQVKKVTVTSKKWQWIKSKNCYGNVSSQVSRYLCKSKKSGRIEPLGPKSDLNMATKNFGGNKLLGGDGSYDVRRLAPSMDERESGLTDGDVNCWPGRKSPNPFSVVLDTTTTSTVFEQLLTDEGLCYPMFDNQ